MSEQPIFDTDDKELDAIQNAMAAGDYEKACDLMVQSQRPVHPDVAYAFKEGFGADFIISTGFNLSEAEKKYGPDWLSR